jgi:hypothetical protein
MSSGAKKSKKKLFFVPLLIILLIVASFSVIHLRSVHKAQKTSGSIPTAKKVDTRVKKSSNTSSNTGSSSESTTAVNNQKMPGAVAASGTLVAPSGSFVSNHHPGKNGTSSQVESVCTTTPGATCFISFEKDGVVKKLDEQTVDGSGSAIWDWDTKGGTLSSGNWQITAVASLNGETKTTVDPNGPLEVE